MSRGAVEGVKKLLTRTCRTAEAERQADAHARRLEASNALQASSGMVLQAILTSMEGPGVAIRTKALRALQSMITADPALLLFVRDALESPMLLANAHALAESGQDGHARTLWRLVTGCSRCRTGSRRDTRPQRFQFCPTVLQLD